MTVVSLQNSLMLWSKLLVVQHINAPNSEIKIMVGGGWFEVGHGILDFRLNDRLADTSDRVASIFFQRR